MTEPIGSGARVTCLDGLVWQLEQALTPEIPLRIHLIASESAALIDTGLASSYPLIGQLLAAAGVRPTDIRMILNTHGHHDHVGSNRRVQEDTRALVVAAAGAAPWVQDHPRQIREFAFHHPDIIPDTPEVRAELEASLDGEVRVDILPEEGTRFNLGRGAVVEVISVPGHVTAELAFYEHSSGTLILGDAVTGIDWSFFHGHARPSTYRASIAKLRALAVNVPLRRALLAHYPDLNRQEFLTLLDRADAYVDRIDREILDLVRQADASLDLEAIWRAVCHAMNKVLEFRGLGTIDGHLRELTANGKLARVGPDRYAWISDAVAT